MRRDGFEMRETGLATASRKKDEGLGEMIRTVVYALLIALVIRTAFFQPFNIPSGSLTPTLLTGDYVFVSMFSYGYSRHSLPLAPGFLHGRLFGSLPERGDIAVFVNPHTGEDYIKRIVGLPGDKIQMTKGVLSINGEPAKRERLDNFVEKEWDPNYGPREIVRYHYRETLPNGVVHEMLGMPINQPEDSGPVDNTDVYVVPESHFFAVGDNRDDSADSRYQDQLGYIPLENLVGRAEIRFISLEPGAHFYEFWRWPWTLRVSRFFGPIH